MVPIWPNMARLSLASSFAALLCVLFSIALAQESERPRIAVFSGPTATIQNNEALVTSNKAREQYGLPPMTDDDGSMPEYDALRPQRLAAPVTVYIEAYSAHPLEEDVDHLFAPPDGYLDPETGEFSEEAQSPDAIPVYETTLEPEDGLYMLPYMARQANGNAWDGYCTDDGVTTDNCRVPFYPDASRIVEEIDRFGLDGSGHNNQLSSIADFDFYRPAPSGGYRSGLPESERTDVGEGDIAPEVWGEDFFTYAPIGFDPPTPRLLVASNVIQEAMATGEYDGGIWFEGSPTTEESIYWFNLVIDTDVPLIGNAAQRSHSMMSNDGQRNIVDSVRYIASGIWQDEEGLDRVGGIMIQEEQIFTSRDVQKGDDRPGNYVATGGHGGILGSTAPMTLTFLPVKKHTHASEVNMTRLPDEVMGVALTEEGLVNVSVAVKDEEGYLVPEAAPQVALVKHAEWDMDDYGAEASTEVEVMSRIDRNLAEFPLSGFVLEGSAPYGSDDDPTMAALMRATMHGMPVVRVGRGNHEGITVTSTSNLYIEGSNLTATKARMLLMASLLKFGSLPLPADPENPTELELDAIRERVAEYQAVFDTH